jgi:VIT1/CCC1 family predicted Fe2+/Mn2+ transporter
MTKGKKPSRSRLSLARSSFDRGDFAASARAHTPEAIAQAAAEEHGGAGSQYIGDMVLGGLDGIITTFAVVSGVAGANLGAQVVLIMGIANLLADGFSMGTGTFLSARSQREYYAKEKARETWEIENFPEGEKRELIEIHRGRGFSEKDARQMAEIQSREPDRWVESMMVEELGLLPDNRTPFRSALTTFASFVLSGSLPLMVYLLGFLFHIQLPHPFVVSLVMSGMALFGLGAAKVFVTHRNPLRSGLEMLIVGGLAAAVAYIVGVLLKGITG